MVVERVDLHLKVRVVVEECRVAVSSSLEFLSHVHYLVFFLPNFAFELFD